MSPGGAINPKPSVAQYWIASAEGESWTSFDPNSHYQAGGQVGYCGVPDNLSQAFVLV
jgi:hypothetical protein